MFQGVFTALITPFKNGCVDIKAFCNLIEWQIQEGVHGIVVCGTTGEAPTLQYTEHKNLIEAAVQTANKRILVVAGATSNNTMYAIKLSDNAKIADAILIAPPYYNKPSQEGIYQHYKVISDSTQRPIIIYNIPSRCGVDISNATMNRLLELPNVVGIKDATGDLNRVIELYRDGISLLSGDDLTALAFNIHGGNGCISVTSNVLPKLCAEMQNHCRNGEFVKAKRIHAELLPLHKIMFSETNPIPVKYAMSVIRTDISPDTRLPLLIASTETQQKIHEILSHFKH